MLQTGVISQRDMKTVTNADKKSNTKAYQGFKAGKKSVKTGKPLYKAAPHMKDETVRDENSRWSRMICLERNMKPEPLKMRRSDEQK